MLRSRSCALPGVLLLVCCGGRDEQSFHDALVVMCTAGDHVDRDAAPADRPAAAAAWVDAHVSNPEARTLLASLGGIGNAERQQRIHDALRRAGIDRCPMFDPGEPRDRWAKVILPDAGDVALGPPPAPDHTILSVAPDGVRFDLGGPIAFALDQFQIEDADIFPSSAGVDDALLALEVDRHASITSNASGLDVVLDPATPWRTLVVVVVATRETYRDRSLVVRGKGSVGTIPMSVSPTGDLALVYDVPFGADDQADRARTLRSPHALGPGDLEWQLAHAAKWRAPVAPSGDDAVELVVTVTHDHILVWSVSGREGTLAHPAATLAPNDLAGLDRSLSAIAARHADLHRIVVVAVRDVPARDYVPVLAIAHAHVPVIELSAGFD